MICVQVSLEVKSVNDAPVASAASLSGTEDQSMTGSVSVERECVCVSDDDNDDDDRS